MIFDAGMPKITASTPKAGRVSKNKAAMQLQYWLTGLPTWGSGQPGQVGNQAALTVEPVPGSGSSTSLLPRTIMKPSQALALHRSEIRDVVLAHRAQNARVFGSVLNGSDTNDSDLDILVDTTPDTTLFDLGAIRYKLRKLLGVPVDVLTPGALPDSFRQIVIAQAKPV